MKLIKTYTFAGKVKIVDENGFSICNMTSNVSKDNEANADYIIALNQQRNELLEALKVLRSSVLCGNDIQTLANCQQAKEIINNIENASQK
jgi:mannitol/fructose-specific phosphotransferase system IIA component